MNKRQLKFLCSSLPQKRYKNSLLTDAQMLISQLERHRARFNFENKTNFDLCTFICMKQGNYKLDVESWLREQLVGFDRAICYRGSGVYNNNKKVV